MRDGGQAALAGDRAHPRQERSLIQVEFSGCFANARFKLSPPRPEIAFAGRSNVGKSSLLNALVGRRKLAFTSRTPGRTRTINVFDLAGRLYLVDLPGYGWAKLSRTERRRLSLLLRGYFTERDPVGVVWLLDLRRDPSPEDQELAAVVTERSLPAIVALTKSDKLRWAQRLERVKAIREKLPVDLADSQWVVTSARTGEGIAQLRTAIERLTGMERLWI